MVGKGGIQYSYYARLCGTGKFENFRESGEIVDNKEIVQFIQFKQVCCNLLPWPPR